MYLYHYISDAQIFVYDLNSRELYLYHYNSGAQMFSLLILQAI